MKIATGRIGTFSGLAVHPFHLKESEVRLADITHALSLQNRYTGHTSIDDEPIGWTVGQHSLLVGSLVGHIGFRMRAYGLLHDASEAYIVDVPRPIKHLFVGYKKAEHRVQRTIYRVFGLEAIMNKRGAPEPKVVKDADALAAKLECYVFFKPDSYSYRRELTGVNLAPYTATIRLIRQMNEHDPATIKQMLRGAIRHAAECANLKVRVEDW